MGRARWLWAALASLTLLAASAGIAVSPVAASARAPGRTTPVAGPPPVLLSNLGYGISRPGHIATGADGNLWFVNIGPKGESSWFSRITPAGAITAFPRSTLPLGGGITSGPDGNLWVTGAGGIARVTPTGVATVFADPRIGLAVDITTGPDGALWFVDTKNSLVGRITTSGAISTFAANEIHGPTAIVAGPDGNLWLNRDTAGLVRMAPAGAMTSVPLPSGARGTSLAIGSDGNVWYGGSGVIGKVTMGGVATAVVSDTARLDHLAVGPDGNIWFSRSYPNSIGHVTAAGVVTYNAPLAYRVGSPNAMILGPDGALWFTTARNVVGRTTIDGVVTMHQGTWVDGPQDIVASPDGDLVFSNTDGDSIGRVSTDGAFSHLIHPVTFAEAAWPRDPRSTAVAPDRTIWFLSDGRDGRMAPDGTVQDGNGFYTERDLAMGPDGSVWITAYDDPIVNPFPPPVLPPPDPGDIEISPVQGGATVRLLGAAIEKPSHITVLPTNTAWFVRKGNELGWVTRAGVMGSFAPAGVTSIEGLTGGPDGNVWFTTGTGNTIGRITPQGATTFFSTGALDPRAITTGPDGNLWFTSWPTDAIGRITPQGEVDSFTNETVDQPTSITTGPDGGLWFTNQENNSIGRVAFGPDAPTTVVATPGTEVARVAWAAPVRDGGTPITTYTVTASPGGATCTTPGGLSCVVAGLHPGTTYTFSVVATNAVGSGPASAPSAATPVGHGGGYHPVTPARILDSRTATGSWSGPLVAGTPRELQVTGSGGSSAAPAGAAAVVVNVTATGATAGSFLTAWPAGSPQPGVSNLNFGVGQTIPNLVTVKLSASGTVSFANAAGAVDVVADVVGWYDDGTIEGDRFTGVAPLRLLDSRTAVGGWDRQLVAGSARDLLVRQPTNPGGVPATATAVVVNLTATEGSAASFLSVRPSGAPPSSASNVNFAAGETIPNLAIVGIGADGAITLSNAVGAVDVIVDLVGYFDPTAGSRFHAVTPTRVLDDRVGVGLSGPWGPGQTRSVVVGGAGGSPVPADATGLVANVTATGATAGSFVTVFPTGGARPASSNLNFGAGQTIPNLVMVGVGTGASVDLFNAQGSVDLVADAVGYFAVQ